MSTRSLSDLLPHLPRPDRAQARRALRDARHTMLQGFALVRESFDPAQLPPPVAEIADKVLRGVDTVAHQADAAASKVILGFLGDAKPAEDDRAATALLAALRETLAALDGCDLRVSESGVREALRGPRAADLSDTNRAGALMRALLDARAIRPRAPRTEAPRANPVTAAEAIFATILMELQEQGTDPARLSASLALATALGEEIAAAGSDAAALARLFAEFRAHV